MNPTGRAQSGWTETEKSGDSGEFAESSLQPQRTPTGSDSLTTGPLVPQALGKDGCEVRSFQLLGGISVCLVMRRPPGRKPDMGLGGPSQEERRERG